MSVHSHTRVGLLCAVLACASSSAYSVVGFGVDGNFNLFQFDPAAPSNSTTIGNVGFLPEGIDFKPGSTTLYAIDVGPTSSQLYTINIATAASTPVGAGFPSVVAGSYNLTTNSRFGFDFNPTTLQGDTSARIRLVSTSGDNLRLNSLTGTVAAVDTALAIAPTGSSAFVDAAAYTNSATLTAGGTTSLYDMDSRNDSLYLQNPPNNGTLNLVGAFGLSIDAEAGLGFDIVSTDPGDATNADELAFAVMKRAATANGAYLLYDVNLATGATTNGRLIDGGRDFTGGLALINVVPEPTSLSLLAAAALIRRRR